MQIVVNRKSFAAACRLASRFSGGNNAKPVLRNVKLACNGTAEMTATDLEMGVRLDADAAIDECGEVLLPTERVNKILTSMEDESISITSDSSEISIKGESAQFHLPIEDVSAFPDVPTFGDGEFISIASGVFKNIINKTVFAAAPESSGKFSATCGVAFECDGAELALIGTDGRRMSVCRGHGVGPVTRTDLPIVPANLLKLLESRLADDDTVVRVRFGPNDVMVDASGAIFYSRLVEGRFPKYAAIIPKNHKHIIKLEAGQFALCVSQARCMTDDESKRVVFGLTKNKMTLTAQGASSGRARVELPIEFDGKVEISFDPVYVLDLLNRLKSDDPITLEVDSHDKPAIIRHGDTQIYVIVPLVKTAKGE